MSKTNTNIKSLIKKSGYTREYIAKQMGISYIYLHLIINDDRKALKKREEIIQFLSNKKAA